MYEPKPENAYVVFGFSDLIHLTSVEGFFDNASDAGVLAKKVSKEKPGYFVVGVFDNLYVADEGTEFEFRSFCFFILAACLDGKTVAPYPRFKNALQYVPDTEWRTNDGADYEIWLGLEVPCPDLNKLVG